MSQLNRTALGSLPLFGLLLLLLQGCEQPFSLRLLPSPAHFEAVSAPAQSGLLSAKFAVLERVDELSLGKLPFGKLSRFTLFIRNTGDLPGTLQSFYLDPPSAAENFSVTTSCVSLRGSSTELCSFQLTVNPIQLGSLEASLLANYDDGKGNSRQLSIPLKGNISNLAYLSFDPPALDLGTDTIGYSVSSTLNVRYNGAHLSTSGFSIKPAMGVTLSNPANSEFTIDLAGTTCGVTITADCVIKLNFAATAIGPRTGSLDLTYYNGSESLKVSAGLQGTGLSGVVLATLSASDASFGNVVFNPPAPKTLTIPVSFSGSVPAEDVVITGPSATDTPFTLNRSPDVSTCFANTSINGNCTLSVSFLPTARAPYGDRIEISYRSNRQARPALTIALGGTGVNPAAITITPAGDLAFGNDPAHLPVSKSFTLKNTGEASVSALSSIAQSDSTNFSASFGQGCATLAAGASCSLTVRFNPTIANALSDAISFTYFDGRVTQSVNLTASGTGTAPAYMTQPTQVIDFGNVLMGAAASAYSARTVTLGFYGTTPISSAAQISASPAPLNSPFEFTGGSFPGGGSCLPVLDPSRSNSCTFSLRLTTTSSGLTAGVQASQSFDVNYLGDGALGSGTLTFVAKMTPQLPPVLVFQSAPASFATLAANDTQSLSFVVKNQSPYFSAKSLSAGVSGDSVFTITGNSCTGGLAPNATCTITITFKPSSARTYDGSLTFNYSDQINPQSISTEFRGTGSSDVRIALTGNGTVDFGNVFLGDEVPTRSVPLRYFGLSAWSPSFTVPAPFSIDASSCGAASDCNLVVSYHPTAAGASNTAVVVRYSPAVNPASASFTLTLKGTAASRRVNLTGSFPPFSKTLLGTSQDQVFTIQNSGSASSRNIALSLDPAAFTLQPDDSSLQNPCGAGGLVLAAGKSCQLKVRFSPDVVGPSSANLTLTYLEGSGPGTSGSASFQLRGTGTVPIQAFAGGFQSCIIDELQQAVCWGNNAYGQLGQGNAAVLTTPPQQIPKIKLGAQSVVRKLGIGAHHVCAIVDTADRRGLVSCWGENANGRLGLGASSAQLSQPQLDSSEEPIGVNLGTDPGGNPYEATEIAAGFEHTCVILNDGKVKCWGGNTNGQLGIGGTSPKGLSASDMGNNLPSVNLKGLSATALSAGAGHTCAVLSDGSAKCWGDNEFGQLGQGTNASPIGARLEDLANLRPINLGANAVASSILGSPSGSTCVTLSSGALKCFGHAANDPAPSPFHGVLGACWARAAANSPAVPCWSDSSLPPTNSLGYFSTDMGTQLKPLSLPAPVVQVALGSGFGCALLTDQSIRCWGVNDRGQLGNGRTSSVGAGQNDMGSSLAATLNGSPAPTSVAAGNEHACAVLNNNTLRCWGSSSENATGLSTLGFSGDALSPSSAPVVYDGRI